jgi:glycosyltransferase involved in cell wall biosynthesis
MKLLIASHQALTILGGGIRTQVLSLKQELERAGHSVDLFDPWEEYRLEDYDWCYVVAAHIGTVHLARSVKQLGVRLAVSPVFFSRRSATVLRARTSLIQFGRGLTGLISESDLTREVCLLADRVLPNTQAEADLLIQGLGVPAGKVRVVRNGGDERFFAARPDRFVSEQGKKDFVLYVGHVGWGRKNLLTLIRAMKEIDCPLVIIGPVLENDHSRRCQDEARTLKDCLLIPGLEHDSELLASAYAACATFCLPSRYETPGLAALEAALAGAKIVITSRGGTREYFQDWAQYVEPGSINALRQALERSRRQPATGDLRAHIRANFLWRNAAQRLIESLNP